MGGTEIRDPISASEVGNEARKVVGQPNSTRSLMRIRRSVFSGRLNGLGKAVDQGGWEERETRE